jgi:hypothetical protein
MHRTILDQGKGHDLGMDDYTHMLTFYSSTQAHNPSDMSELEK